MAQAGQIQRLCPNGSAAARDEDMVCREGPLDQLLANGARALLRADHGEVPPLRAEQLMNIAQLLSLVSNLVAEGNDSVTGGPNPVLARALLSEPTSRDALISIAAAAVRAVMPCKAPDVDDDNRQHGRGSSKTAVGSAPSPCAAFDTGVQPQGSADSACVTPSSQMGSTPAPSAHHSSSSSGDTSCGNRASGGSGSQERRQEGRMSAAREGASAVGPTGGPAWGGAASADPALRAARWELFQCTTHCLIRLAKTVVPAQGPLPPSPCVIDFARRLLRSQLLHCCARLCAAAAADARRSLRSVGAAAIGPSHAATQRSDADATGSGGDGAVRAGPDTHAGSDASALALWEALEQESAPGSHLAVHLLCLLMYLAEAAMNQCVLPGAAVAVLTDHQRARSAYVSELGAALRDSCVLDHAAAALMLGAQLAGAAGLEGAAGAPDEQRLQPVLLEATLNWGVAVQVAEAISRRCGRIGHAAEGMLDQAITSPCVAHLQLVLAVAELCAGDGGPTYGLPPELLRALPVARGLQGGRLAHVPVRLPEGARPLLNHVVLHTTLLLLEPPRRVPRVVSRTALALMLRIGRLALESARVWEEEEGEQRGADQELRGAAEAAPRDRRSTAPGTVRSAEAGLAQPVRRAPLLEREVIVKVLYRAAHSMEAVLAASDDAEGWAAAAAERWRLAIASIDCSLRWPAWGGFNVVDPGHETQRQSVLPRTGALPLRPPPQLAAALEGGLLPCLERLLRRAAEDPDGPEGTATWRALHMYKVITDGLVTGLLAYGEPRAVASLVATLCKAVRRVVQHMLERLERSAAAGRGGGECRRGVPDIGSSGAGSSSESRSIPGAGSSDRECVGVPHGAWAVLCCVCDILVRSPDLLEGLTSTRPDGSAGGTAGAAVHGRQFAHHVMQVACEALPPLACLVQRAAARRAPLPPSHTGISFADAISTSSHAVLSMLYVVLQMHVPSAGPAAAAPAAAAAALPAFTELRRTWLEAAGAVPLLGSMLRLWWDQQQVRQDWLRMGWHRDCPIAFCLLGVIKACAREVRLGVLAEALAAAQGGLQGVERSGPGGDGGGMAALSPGVLAAHWPEEAVRDIALTVQALGAVDTAAGRNVIALLGLIWQQLDMWRAGSQGDVGDGPLANARVTAWRGDAAALARICSAEPPGARGLLRTCGHPGCTNLGGDSEAELPLKACAGCGVVGYCCRECQTAHWRAGHKAECAGRRGG